jgi:hypothetical protein
MVRIRVKLRFGARISFRVRYLIRKKRIEEGKGRRKYHGDNKKK